MYLKVVKPGSVFRWLKSSRLWLVTDCLPTPPAPAVGHTGAGECTVQQPGIPLSFLRLRGGCREGACPDRREPGSLPSVSLDSASTPGVRPAFSPPHWPPVSPPQPQNPDPFMGHMWHVRPRTQLPHYPSVTFCSDSRTTRSELCGPTHTWGFSPNRYRSCTFSSLGFSLTFSFLSLSLLWEYSMFTQNMCWRTVDVID